MESKTLEMIKNYQVKSTVFEICKTRNTKKNAIIMENERKKFKNALRTDDQLGSNEIEKKQSLISNIKPDRNNYKGLKIKKFNLNLI
jgi:hypothetical protein